MKFSRTYSALGDPYAGVAFEPRTSRIVNPDGRLVFEAKDIMIPSGWSQVATDIIAQKYFRKAGVPSALKRVEEPGVPEWLWRSEPEDDATFGSETDAREVFHRLAGTWAYWGFKYGYFDTEHDARAYYDEIACWPGRSAQLAAWLTPAALGGGIAGPARATILSPQKARATRSVSAYEHPARMLALSECKRRSRQRGGIMDLWVREADLQIRIGHGLGLLNHRSGRSCQAAHDSGDVVPARGRPRRRVRSSGGTTRQPRWSSSSSIIRISKSSSIGR